MSRLKSAIGASGPAVTLRPARTADHDRLPELQLDSRTLFAAVRRMEVERLPLVGAQLMREAGAQGGLVVAELRGVLVGFGLCAQVEGAAHLHQMSVAARSTGRGIGSAILRDLLAIASRRGDEALTLITYADIPWNQPFYERHGLSAIDPRGAPPYLRELLFEEQAVGIDVTRRSLMSRPLHSIGSPA